MRGKPCGCTIAGQLITSEISRKKHLDRLKDIKEKLAKSSEKKQHIKLKRKKKDLKGKVKDITKYNSAMRKRFSKYVKSSGYVPPAHR